MDRFVRAVCGLTSIALLVAGCASRPSFTLGGDCELSSECAAPLVCRLGRCREECRGDRDCRVGLVCLRDDGLGACELDGETCVLTSDCAEPLVCLSGRCANACEDDRDCPPGASCIVGTDGARGCRDVFMDPCELNSDCVAPYICAPDGVCRDQCVTDRDCRDGTACDRSGPIAVCVIPSSVDGGLDAAGLDAAGTDAGDLDAAGLDGGISDAGVTTGAAPPSMIAAGDRHTCAIATGELRCWGSNLYGQLGDGSSMDRPLPTAVSTIAASATLVAGGASHGCATTATALYCWGDNAMGEVGDGSLAATRPAPVMLAGGPATALAAARDHGCAIRAGVVECWGDNTFGQLGDGTTSPHRAPAPTRPLAGVPVAIDARGGTTCVLLDDGRVQCWGQNDLGQLGNGTATAGATPTPQLVVSLTDAVEVAVGAAHTCARTRDGSVWCWGSNARGALGDGSPFTFARETPGRVPVPGAAVELAAGGEHVCARLLDGTVSCWGGNSLGQVGVNNAVADPRVATPAPVAGITSALELAAGDAHTCARVASGLRCWGGNGRGELGSGTPGGTSYMPVTVMWP